MALLKCDICGGGLTMDINGEAAKCDNCGMNHTKERLKVKLSEAEGNSSENKNDSLF